VREGDECGSAEEHGEECDGGVRQLMKVVRSLSVAELSALAVFILSSLLMVIKILILNEIPSSVEWLHQLSPVGDSVLTSLMAGCVFFFVVNALFDRSEFGRIRPWMKIKFQQVAGQYEAMIRDMAKEANVKIPDDDVFLIDLNMLLELLNPNVPAPLIVNRQGHHANWIGLMRYYSNRSRRFLDSIERRSSLLRSDSLRLIDRVYDSPFFGQIDMVDTPIRNENMKFMISSLSRHRDLMCEVRDHADSL
jgi:hypothetical protein